MRAWTGPAVLSFGFRPLFLLGAGWAALAMAVWIASLSGHLEIPSQFSPVAWHAHEFLFGYLGAVIAGFLLTAVPNWTGRLPVVGWALGGLVFLWLAGRLAVGISAMMPAMAAALIDLAFPLALSAVILREIVAGRNWRNLIVLALLFTFMAANALFHLEAAQGTEASQGTGLRLGLAAALMMISVIGGRIVPSFTRNWLAKKGSEARPVPPMQRFDKAVLAVTLIGLLSWVVRPEWPVTGVLLLVAGVMQTMRLMRWKGGATGSEPLVWVLHAGYAFVPLGALVMAAGILVPDALEIAAAQHVWMAGAVGLMTLAVMTRATLGHSGRELHAGPATASLYVLLICAVAMRLAAGIWPELSMTLHWLSVICWVLAFGGFVVVYGPMLVSRRPG